MSLIVIPKKAHCVPAATADISTGRDGGLTKLRFRMLATVSHWRRDFFSVWGLFRGAVGFGATAGLPFKENHSGQHL